MQLAVSPFEVKKSSVTLFKSRNKRFMNKSFHLSKILSSTVDNRDNDKTLQMDDSKSYINISRMGTDKRQSLIPIKTLKLSNSLRSSSDEDQKRIFNNIRIQDIQ